MKKITKIFCFLLIGFQAFAQDSIIYTDFHANLDSMVNLYYVQQTKDYKYIERPVDYDSTFVPRFTPEIYQARIDSIESVVPLVYNSNVQAYINVYAFKNRDKVEIMLGLAEYYFPLFEEILELNEVPQELKYLAIIESALNPRARSRVGAVGLWQFMPATGRMHKLSITGYVDERRDPIKSTHAAATYLKSLYGMFGDWTLAIAAYNCGPGNVRKAIYRSGGKRDFWDIYPYLPRETRGYVPAYIAAYYVFEYHAEHNLYPRVVNYPPAVDTVMVTEAMTFNQISKVIGISDTLLEDINPQYKMPAIAKTKTGMPLYLPVEYVKDFIVLQDSIIAYKDSVNTDSVQIAKAKQAAKNEKSVVYYTIKTGDNLSLIASWYDVRLSDLRRWNNIRGNTIRAGKRLTIYVPAHKYTHYAKINSMTYAQKQRLAGNSSSGNTQTTSTKQTQSSSGEYQYYTVQQGDSLWSISQKYTGVSVDDLKRLNGLSGRSTLQPGQKIKVKTL